MGYMGMCSPPKIGFFSHIGHEQGMVLALQSGNIGYVSWKRVLNIYIIIIRKTTTKSPTLILFRVTVPAAKVINRVAKIADFGYKWGKSLWKWSAYPHPAFLGESPQVQCHSNYQFLFHVILSATTCMHKLKDDMINNKNNG